MAAGWIHTRLAWLMAVRERLLEFYSDSTTQFISTLALALLVYFNLAKVTIPCMCTAALSLSQTASR